MSHKRGDDKLMAVTLSDLNRFPKFLTARFSGKFAIRWLLESPPHLILVAALPCKAQCPKQATFSTNVTINDKSQGSVGVATHWRCGKIFSSHIFTNLLLSLPVKKKTFWNWWTFGKIAGKKVDCTVVIVSKGSFLWCWWRMQMRIIDHSVGCAVWTLWTYFVS